MNTKTSILKKILILSLCSLNSCSPLFEQSESLPQFDFQEQDAPVDIEVSQAFFNKDKLNVKVVLKTLKDFNPDDIVLGVAGLIQGDVVEQSLKRARDVIGGGKIDANSRVVARFELNSSNLTEYQVICSWGQKAKKAWAKKVNANYGNQLASLKTDLDHDKIIAKSLASQDVRDLELIDLDITSNETTCSKKPCDLIYTVAGKFLNQSSKLVTNANLAIGLYWVNSGQLPSLPEAYSEANPNEELITVGLNLAPGQLKEFSIKLDKEVPQIPGGGFVPHVRLIK